MPHESVDGSTRNFGSFVRISRLRAIFAEEQEQEPPATIPLHAVAGRIEPQIGSASDADREVRQERCA